MGCGRSSHEEQERSERNIKIVDSYQAMTESQMIKHYEDFDEMKKTLWEFVKEDVPMKARQRFLLEQTLMMISKIERKI